MTDANHHAVNLFKKMYCIKAVRACVRVRVRVRVYRVHVQVRGQLLEVSSQKQFAEPPRRPSSTLYKT